MSAVRRSVWRFMVATVLLASPTHAAPQWIAEAAHAPAPDLPHDARGITLLRSMECEIRSDLKIRWHERRVVRILSSQGLDLGDFVIQLEPEDQLRSFRAWTVGPHGETSAGMKEAVESNYSPEFYTDVRRVALRAPKPEVGDLVAMEASVESRLEFATWTWLPQADDLALALARFSMHLPRGWTVESRSDGVEARVSRGRDGAHVIEVGPLAGWPSEPSAPVPSVVLPRVSIRFVDADGHAPFRDWAEVARWYHDLTEPRFASERAFTLAPDPGTTGDRAAMVAALARRVQHGVRYAAIELGRQRWEPDDARITWERRYGDCKDKAVLLIAALQSQGITARPVLTAPRTHRRIDPSIPDPWQFNHCIVAIQWPDATAPPDVTSQCPSGRSWTFFDPTSTAIPFGLLPASEAGTWAVIADPDEGLVQLPKPGANRIACETRATLGADGEMRGTMRLDGVGPSGFDLAAMFDEGTEAVRRERAASLFAGPWPEPTVERLVCSIDSTRLAVVIDIDFRIRDASRRRSDGLQTWLPLVMAHRRPPPDARDRRLPVYLGGPLEVSQRVSLEWPSPMQPDSLSGTQWTSGAGEFRVSRRVDGNRLEVTRVYRVNEPIVESSRYGEVLGLWRAAYQSDMAPLILRRP